MPRAVLKNGVVVPTEPLPSEWKDGKELVVEEVARQDNSEDVDRWIQEMEASTGQIDLQEWQELQATLDQMHDEAKAMVRRQMGLS
jgi:hypothetical protein